MLKYRHSVDQLLTKLREVISQLLVGRHYENLQLRIEQETPQHKGNGDPGLTYATERLNDEPARAVLKIIRDVILNRRGRGK